MYIVTKKAYKNMRIMEIVPMIFWSGVYESPSKS